MSRLGALQSPTVQRVSTGRNAMVAWAKNATSTYEGVAIRNLNRSWANGLGNWRCQFCTEKRFQKSIFILYKP